MNDQEIMKKLEEIKVITIISTKEALTMDEASVITGLSKSYLYKLCQYSRIPHYKSKGGKNTYFRKAELQEWMLYTKVNVIN